MNLRWYKKVINKNGYNEVKKRETLFQKVIKQLTDFLVLIMIITSIVSGIIGEISHAIVITIVVIVYTVLGAVQEGQTEIDEASLTGEPIPVEKQTIVVFTGNTQTGDNVNMAHMNKDVTYSRGKGIVGTKAENNEIDMIAEYNQSCIDGINPLQIILNKLAIWLGIACLIICVLGFSIGFLRDGHLLELILVTLSLIVAAIWKGC